MLAIPILLTFAAGCFFGPCQSEFDFTIVVEEQPEPESAWATVSGVEQEMTCHHIFNLDETHCSISLESEEDLDDVSAAAIVIEGTRIALDPEEAEYEEGAERCMGDRYFLRYAHPYTGCIDSYDVPFCEDESLPIAGDGCFEPCKHDGDYCETGSCQEAWIGCGPEEDCDVCGTSDWICL
jgi:hypothetical protein